jgi:hypothetical protein
MQERVFVQGAESVRFSVSLRDTDGRALPLPVQNAVAHEVPPPHVPARYPGVPMNFNDDGTAGDQIAGDHVYTAALQPAAQGFATLHGQIRVEVYMQVRDAQGYTYFDIVYTPSTPAHWRGDVHQALEDGSLAFYLPIQVEQAGRYVVTGRVDDANGRPFALLNFNQELTAGPHEIRMAVFGKLVRDNRPAFPLTLRDVDGFLLLPAGFPDRMLLPRLQGAVYASRDYTLQQFSDAEWSGPERERYLAELGRDVAQAQARVDQLGQQSKSSP